MSQILDIVQYNKNLNIKQQKYQEIFSPQQNKYLLVKCKIKVQIKD